MKKIKELLIKIEADLASGQLEVAQDIELPMSVYGFLKDCLEKYCKDSIYYFGLEEKLRISTRLGHVYLQCKYKHNAKMVSLQNYVDIQKKSIEVASKIYEENKGTYVDHEGGVIEGKEEILNEIKNLLNKA